LIKETPKWLKGMFEIGYTLQTTLFLCLKEKLTGLQSKETGTVGQSS
jgi:hypothetical protein